MLVNEPESFAQLDPTTADVGDVADENTVGWLVPGQKQAETQ